MFESSNIPYVIDLAVVVPCKNEEDQIYMFYRDIISAMAESSYLYSLIFVDDNSLDNTAREIDLIMAQHDSICKEIGVTNCVKVIYLKSTGKGKEQAMLTGLKYALDYKGVVLREGNVVAIGPKYTFISVMDVDLEDPPYLLDGMVHSLQEDDNCQQIVARRESRPRESIIRSIGSKLYYSLLGEPANIRDFRVIRRQVVAKELSEHRNSLMLKVDFKSSKYQTSYCNYSTTERAAGVSKWNLFGLTKYAIKGLLRNKLAN